MKTETRESIFSRLALNAISTLYGEKADPNLLVFQTTRKEFQGDLTLVCFGLTKLSGKNPAQTAQEIGEYLCNNTKDIVRFNVVTGFLNLELNLKYWTNYIIHHNANAIDSDLKKSKVMVEYSSPNTNKPLHLGHVRNNLLGFSISRILEAAGHSVTKVNLINDRGIHICKSMLAWQMSGKNESPENTGIKGDHLVGKYYVEFDIALKAECNSLLTAIESGDFLGIEPNSRVKIEALNHKLTQTDDEQKRADLRAELKMIVNNQTSLMKQAQTMLQKWEEGDVEVIDLWKKMNAWVYQGFDETYKKLGVSFDKFYFESNTYILGKDIVDQGLNSGILYRKEDGSVWIDLTNEGLDHKLLLRSDGTSVYMTQDLGTAVLRHKELLCNDYIYVVGNEQDYHFKVLSHTLLKLGYDWAKGIHHLSYGMVDLPSGRMKSREGTVVDADDLIDEIIKEAGTRSEALGKTEEFNSEEKSQLYKTIGLGALKYFILKVDPKKRMVFNPEDSIDLNGNTGPFIQYTYARIRSLFRKSGNAIPSEFDSNNVQDESLHRSIIRTLENYHTQVNIAAENYSPAIIANYAYDLAKEFNQFYHDFSILKEADLNVAAFRLYIAGKVAETLKSCMFLLGIEMPERM